MVAMLGFGSLAPEIFLFILTESIESQDGLG